jgi:serine/threonine-protein kinase HipA
MSSRQKTQSLHVFLSSHFVGTLSRHPNGAIEFAYSENWINTGFSISLSLPLLKKKFVGEEASFYFDNLLPDNKTILLAIAQKFKTKSEKQFDILQAIGRDCIGALSFYDEPMDKIDFLNKLKIRPLSNSDIERKIKNLAFDSPLGMDSHDFRISLAGAQEKMALLLWKGSWYEPKGQTPTSHIIKKKMGRVLEGIDCSQSVDNEHISLMISKQAFNMNTCESFISTFNSQRVLCIKRFDRVWKDNFLFRIPQEDMCQALGISPIQKYERDGGPSIQSIMHLLENSNNAKSDRINLFKTAMINDLLFNTDGHAKNISIYRVRKGYALTPFYDLLSAHFIFEQDSKLYENLRSSWSVNKKFKYSQISLSDWNQEAIDSNLTQDEFEEILTDLSSGIKKVDSVTFSKDVDLKILKSIQTGLKRRANVLGL